MRHRLENHRAEGAPGLRGVDRLPGRRIKLDRSPGDRVGAYHGSNLLLLSEIGADSSGRNAGGGSHCIRMDDAVHSVDELRSQWLDNGAIWFFGNPPQGWNPYSQLLKGNLPNPMSGVLISAGPAQGVVQKAVQRGQYELVAA